MNTTNMNATNTIEQFRVNVKNNFDELLTSENFIPTITGFTGTLTYTIHKAKYIKSGNLITFFIDFTVTDVGTATSLFSVSLPVPATVNTMGNTYGINNSTGESLNGIVEPTVQKAYFYKYTGGSPIATNTFKVGGEYII